jgi:hypothetical protein
MSLFQAPDGQQHTHHHGLLAGVGAGAMAVLVLVPLLLWMVHQRIAGPVGTAMIAIVVAVTVLVVAACGYVVLYLMVRAVHHVRHPETVMGRITLRARPGAVNQPPARPVLQSQPVAELPAPAPQTHNYFYGADAAAQALNARPGQGGEAR